MRREAYPAPWAINVRAEDALTHRLRGGSWAPIAAAARPSETVYRDRKLVSDGRLILASRLGDHADLDLGRDISDIARATAFQLAEAGEQGGAVVAMVPHRDAVLLAATADELWALQGDPASGALRNVSRDVGMVGANAWCQAGDAVYFLSARGLHVAGADGSGLKSLSEDVLPEDLVGVTDTGCTLTYHHEDRGVYIHLPNSDASWFFDAGRGAFWPFVSGETESHVLLGPFRLGGPEHYGVIQAIQGVMAAGSVDVDWRIIAADTAEEAAANGKSAITASLAGAGFSQYVAASGTWQAGRSRTSRPRVRGAWAVVWLSANGTWAYESVVMDVISAGRIRP